MSRHLLLTSWKLEPKSWSKAFPGATVLHTEDASCLMPTPTTDGDYLCWVVTSIDAWEQRIRELAKEGARVIALSENTSRDETLVVLACGARGYTDITATPEELHAAALAVANGGFWVGNDFMQSLIQATTTLPYAPDARTDILHQLTSREDQVANLVAKGMSNKIIAQRLDITERTVKAHLSSIFQKTATRDRLQLALLVNSQRHPPSSHS